MSFYSRLGRGESNLNVTQLPVAEPAPSTSVIPLSMRDSLRDAMQGSGTRLVLPVKTPAVVVLPDMCIGCGPDSAPRAEAYEYEEPSWLDQTMFAGVANKWLLVGGAVVLAGGYLFTRKKSPAMGRRSRR